MTAQENLSSNLLKKVKEYVKSVDPAAEVFLFGSRARGNAHEDSDWDILILIPGPVDLGVEQTFRHKLFEIELAYGQAISTFVYSKQDWIEKHRVTPLFKSIQLEGILI